MNTILRFLSPLFRLNLSHPFLIIFVAVAVAAICTVFALKLKVDTDIANLLPDDHPNVLALEKLKEEVGNETDMQVAIKSPSFEANKLFAEALIPKSLQLRYPRYNDVFFNRAEYRKDTNIMQENALYLATDDELDEIVDWLKDEIVTAKEEANPFFFSLDDEDEEGEESSREFQESYDVLVPSEYMLNADSTVLLLKFFPTGSKSDVRFLEDMFEAYDNLIAELDPGSYHPEMQVQFGGRLKRHLEEIESIMDDVYSSFATGIGSVVLLVMFYFFFKKYIHYRRSGGDGEHTFWSHFLRMPIPIVIIGIPLLTSLLWTFGITYWQLGVLNTMTSVLFVILFGLGIDYGIHYYARYIELRSDGQGPEEALTTAYNSTGKAILVSALTTAAALYILIIADFRGFSEFGFISGTGILLALMAMLYVLPAIIVVLERWNLILFNPNEAKKADQPVHKFPFSKTIVITGSIVSVLVLIFSNNLTFEYNFSNLQPEFPEYRKFREVAGSAEDDAKRNPAYIIADTDDQVAEILQILRHTQATDSVIPTIKSIEALQERYPLNEEIATQKLNRISEIRELLKDPFLVNQESEELDKLRKASKQTSILEIADVPDYLKAQFITREGEVGKFVIVYPVDGMGDGRMSIAFKADVGKVELEDGSVFYAASTSLVAASMLELLRKESPYMVGATLLFVFIFMLISFKSLRWALIAMVPLLIGLLFLFGVMLVFGMQFNFYNLVVLPAILGIGEDSGVHLAHRYREEGKNSMWQVLSSTGQHVTMGSLTTMLGFSGLLFVAHPGLQSLGAMAVIGIGATLLTSIVFMPAMVQWLEDKNAIKF